MIMGDFNTEDLHELNMFLSYTILKKCTDFIFQNLASPNSIWVLVTLGTHVVTHLVIYAACFSSVQCYIIFAVTTLGICLQFFKKKKKNGAVCLLLDFSRTITKESDTQSLTSLKARHWLLLLWNSVRSPNYSIFKIRKNKILS